MHGKSRRGERRSAECLFDPLSIAIIPARMKIVRIWIGSSANGPEGDRSIPLRRISRE
jgi:hypothetical protein